MSALVTTATGLPRQPAELVRHSTYLTRALRTLWRQPAFAAITLTQPVIWLLLFGELFQGVADIPGFAAEHGSYLEFITPGVVVMTALFSSGWARTVYIDDMNRGVMDRMLASPVRRGAMMIGTLSYQALTTVIQTLIIFAIAFGAGARFAGGAAGLLVTVLAAVLISVIMASLSNALALLLRQQEALIGVSQFLVLPLQFLSAIMDISLAPAWVQTIARYNPVDWAVVASRRCRATRTGLMSGPDWDCWSHSPRSWLGSRQEHSARTSARCSCSAPPEPGRRRSWPLRPIRRDVGRHGRRGQRSLYDTATERAADRPNRDSTLRGCRDAPAPARLLRTAP